MSLQSESSIKQRTLFDVRERWQVGSSLQHGPLERPDEKGSSLREVLKGICQFGGCQLQGMHSSAVRQAEHTLHMICEPQRW